MDYIKEAIERLEEYNLLISAEENLQNELNALSMEEDLIKAQRISFASGKGAGEPDDNLVNNIQKRLELDNRLSITQNRIEQIDRALRHLSEDEKLLLNILFINSSKNSIEYASERLGIEKSQIYRKRTDCLKKIGRALLGYGVA